MLPIYNDKYILYIRHCVSLQKLIILSNIKWLQKYSEYKNFISKTFVKIWYQNQWHPYKYAYTIALWAVQIETKAKSSRNLMKDAAES